MIAFRPMAEDDLVLFHAWLQRPHVKRWWRNRETYEQVVAHYLPRIEGREPTDHYLILVDGRDVTACAATVEEDDRRSWRAFEKAGFTHVRDVEEDGLRHRLMRLERTATVRE